MRRKRTTTRPRKTRLDEAMEVVRGIPGATWTEDEYRKLERDAQSKPLEKLLKDYSRFIRF